MFTHPELMWAQSKQHHTDLIAEADAYRLLAAARRSRRARGSSGTDGDGGGGPDNAVVRVRPARDFATRTSHPSAAS
jgi:hypothetical protein